MPSPIDDMSGYGLVVVPYERTTTYLPGAAEGPAALCREFQGLAESEGFRPPAAVLTVGEECCRSPRLMERAVTSAVRQLKSAGAMPVLMGGEHTSTAAAAVALLGKGPAGVIQFDAHADLRRSYEGSRYNHACVMRRIVENRPFSLLPIGIRAYSRGEAAFMEKRGIHSLPGRSLPRWRSLLPSLLQGLPRTVYLTVDMDYFDPSVVPGVGTPEPGGGEWYRTLDMLDMILGCKEVAGFDIVELCPPREREVSLRAAARLMLHILAAPGFEREAVEGD